MGCALRIGSPIQCSVVEAVTVIGLSKTESFMLGVDVLKTGQKIC